MRVNPSWGQKKARVTRVKLQPLQLNVRLFSKGLETIIKVTRVSGHPGNPAIRPPE